ncbi:MAG: antibiotic biosynthesis monooxygenase [Chloroflexota bacterium]|nr:antibiotic biosynthesis monooxygenase [Chloroflexota bacterium]
MYVRISRIRFDPDKYDQVMEIIRDVPEVMRRQPGFLGYFAAADRAVGTGLAVSTWESEVQAWVSRAVLGDTVPRMQALGVELDAPEVYEMVVQV